MGLFRKMFGRKPAETRAEPSEERDPNFESKLEKSFGLQFNGNSWSYNAVIQEKFASQMADPDLCLGVLEGLREQLQFDQIIVVAGKPAVLICNTSPPLAFVVGMKAKGLAALIAAITEANRKIMVTQYAGTSLLQLP